MVDTANTIWRDFVTDGVPASGAKQPEKVKIREWGTDKEGRLAALEVATNAGATNAAFLDPEASARGGLKSLLGRGIYLGDDAQIVLGQEHLAAWYKALSDKRASFLAGATPTVPYAFLLGDSKVAGTGTTAGQLDALLDYAAKRSGHGYADFGRFGYGGEDSVDMDTTHLATLMAHGNFPNTNLAILNFGTNERVTTARTLAQTDAAMRSIIAKLWNTGAGGRSTDDLAIMIMGQTAANNETAGYYQNDDLMRELNTLYRDIARDTGCCFVDCYSLFRQPHAKAGWMDVSVGGSQVHPSDYFNGALVSVLADILFPPAFTGIGGLAPDEYPDSSIRFPATAAMTAASLPSAWPLGWTMSRITTAGSAWPVDGTAFTFRSATRINYQRLVSRADATVLERSSNGGVDTWNVWTPLTGTATVDPASLAAGASTAVGTITVTGAALGMAVQASFSLNQNGVWLHAWVSAANTVSYQFTNFSGAVRDLASGTLKVRVTA